MGDVVVSTFDQLTILECDVVRWFWKDLPHISLVSELFVRREMFRIGQMRLSLISSLPVVVILEKIFPFRSRSARRLLHTAVTGVIRPGRPPSGVTRLDQVSPKFKHPQASLALAAAPSTGADELCSTYLELSWNDNLPTSRPSRNMIHAVIAYTSRCHFLSFNLIWCQRHILPKVRTWAFHCYKPIPWHQDKS